ncbi:MULTISPECIES: PH domain-containing protein [unclassified Streptomyces]|uniref:PH domain-containing protein n=1 Tax=unclassified Streptomyces TaxID=2593676 RepID=UPI002252B787|nr:MULTISPECIES: PH domain-containing protein [unclassified Streptomyces]MCX4524085.1 PH domain-containing protein [Streptomyces sp. NBC_01551]MCX4545397.1 PH domain-containing protein [Streptomyces sp. NBC_01565]
MTPDTAVRHQDPADSDAWGRLNPRLFLVNLSVVATPLATFGATTVITGGEINLQVLITFASFLITCLVISGISTMRLVTTRYRVTEDRVELHKGWFFRSERSIPVDRIRSADLTANPLHRIFGLTSLKIATGDQASSGGGLSLDGLSIRDADALRRKLSELRHARQGLAVSDPEDDDTLAELDWAWLRYAPLTLWGVGGVFIAVGSVYRTLHEMKIDPLELGIVKDIEDRFGSVPLWYGILVTLLVIVVIGVAGSTATFIEGWGGYRLDRPETGLLRVRRGLLITRSVSIEERRLRGAEVAEPLLLRWAGGARLKAVASGLGNEDENSSRSRLTPPVPLALARRIAADVLGESVSPTTAAQLAPHPRAALRRRINRALTWSVLLAAPFVGLGLWLTPVLVHTGWITAVVLFAVGVAFAFDAYRNLGHAVHGPYLVTRAGTFTRRTAAVQRDGIIGWSITRSVFQRRAGLLTLGAATAVGNGVYKVRDVRISEGLAFAEETVPGLLAPFIERVPAGR